MTWRGGRLSVKVQRVLVLRADTFLKNVRSVPPADLFLVVPTDRVRPRDAPRLGRSVPRAQRCHTCPSSDRNRNDAYRSAALSKRPARHVLRAHARRGPLRVGPGRQRSRRDSKGHRDRGARVPDRHPRQQGRRAWRLITASGGMVVSILTAVNGPPSLAEELRHVRSAIRCPLCPVFCAGTAVDRRAAIRPVDAGGAGTGRSFNGPAGPRLSGHRPDRVADVDQLHQRLRDVVIARRERLRVPFPTGDLVSRVEGE
jgi:hypothetical protein